MMAKKKLRMIDRILMNLKNIFLEETWRLTHPSSIFEKEGCKFFLPDRRDFIQQRIISRNDFYERERLEELKKYVKKSFVYLDIGANIGHHTIYFYKKLGAKKVYSFEPHKHLVEIINKNLKINKIKNGKVYNVAVGNNEKRVKIYTPKPKRFLRKNFAVVRVDNHKGQQETNMVRIDSLKFNNKIDVIKIDTEGFEKEVLRGGVKLIEKDRPLVWVEVKKENESFVFDFFKKRNYRRILVKREDNFFIPK